MFILKNVGNFVAGPFRQMYEDYQPGQLLPELPDYTPPNESKGTSPKLAEKYPLNIISPKSHAFLNSCYANMTDKQRVQGDQFVLINKVDAKNRNVKSGDKVKVFNERGSFDAVTEVSNDVSPGIVVATLGYWRQLNRGTVNSISSAKLADMGNAPTFSDNLVEVEKI
jgi:anaerobic selenocysteine-containing dehydrogenase